MPAQLDSTGLLADVDVTGRDHAWPLAKPQLVLQGELRLENIVLAEVRSAVVYMRFLNVRSGCGLGWVVRSEVAGEKAASSYRKFPSTVVGDLGSSSVFGSSESDMMAPLVERERDASARGISFPDRGTRRVPFLLLREQAFG